MSRHRNWHIHTHLAVTQYLTCDKSCMLCINAYCAFMSLFLKFSFYCTSSYYSALIFTPSYSFLGFLPSFIWFDVQMPGMTLKPHLPRFDLINELPWCGTTAGEHGCAVAKRVPVDLSNRIKLSTSDQFSVQFSSLAVLQFGKERCCTNLQIWCL